MGGQSTTMTPLVDIRKNANGNLAQLSLFLLLGRRFTDLDSYLLSPCRLPFQKLARHIRRGRLGSLSLIRGWEHIDDRPLMFVCEVLVHMLGFARKSIAPRVRRRNTYCGLAIGLLYILEF